jgi:ribonucleoside-diphosphate reductase beta chain
MTAKTLKLFDEQIALKPDNYPWAKVFISILNSGFWTHDEFTFSSDIHTYKTELTDKEREIVNRSLSAISQVETQVKRYWARLGDNLPNPSMINLGYTLAAQEVTHGAAYQKLLDMLGLEDIFEENLKLDIIQGRVGYLRKYSHKFHSDNKKQFIYSLVLFTLFVENVSLFSQFYTINWFGRFKNVLKDTNKQTEYSAREEQIHSDVGTKVINTLREEYPELFDKELEEKVLSETELALKYELKIIDWIIGDYQQNELSADILKEFIKNRLNKSLIGIGYKPIFDVNEDLILKTKWFDEQIMGNNSSDFFHAKPVEYQRKSKGFDSSDLF